MQKRDCNHGFLSGTFSYILQQLLMLLMQYYCKLLWLKVIWHRWWTSNIKLIIISYRGLLNRCFWESTYLGFDGCGLIITLTTRFSCKFVSPPSPQNGRHFKDDICRCIFVNVQRCISITISLRFVPMGLVDNNPEFVYIMSRHRIGDKLLSEAMLTRFTDAYMRQEEEINLHRGHDIPT